MIRAVLTFPKRRPFVFGTCLAGFKNGAVDLVVQKKVEGRESIDWRRTTVFTSFGLLFNGAWQYFLFVKMMPRLCPQAVSFARKPIREKLKDIPGLKQLALQNFVENGINNALIYYPLFYTLKEYIEGGAFEDGIKKYRKNMKDDLLAIWKVWVPAQFINFAFCPLWLRVPYVACLSCFWTAFVSFTRGKKEIL